MLHISPAIIYNTINSYYLKRSPILISFSSLSLHLYLSTTTTLCRDQIHSLEDRQIEIEYKQLDLETEMLKEREEYNKKKLAEKSNREHHSLSNNPASSSGSAGAGGFNYLLGPGRGNMMLSIFIHI